MPEPPCWRGATAPSPNPTPSALGRCVPFALRSGLNRPPVFVSSWRHCPCHSSEVIVRDTSDRSYSPPESFSQRNSISRKSDQLLWSAAERRYKLVLLCGSKNWLHDILHLHTQSNKRRTSGCRIFHLRWLIRMPVCWAVYPSTTPLSRCRVRWPWSQYPNTHTASCRHPRRGGGTVFEVDEPTIQVHTTWWSREERQSSVQCDL